MSYCSNIKRNTGDAQLSITQFLYETETTTVVWFPGILFDIFRHILNMLQQRYCNFVSEACALHL